MKKKPLIWHMYPSFLLLSLLAMIAVAVTTAGIVRTFHYRQTEQQLESASRLIARQLSADSALWAEKAASGLCESLAEVSGYRVTIVLPSGRVAGDSEKDPSAMDDHSDREEIIEAIGGEMGCSERHSDTLGEDMMYVAVPVKADGDLKGVVRTSVSLAHVDEAMSSLWRRMHLAALVIAAIAIVATVFVSRSISKPLARMRSASESFGHAGSYDSLPSSRITELDVLATTFNTMADNLNLRIATIRRQNEEQSTLLACMVESVFAVDIEKKIIKTNSSADRLFEIDPAESVGRSIMEVVRNTDLLELVSETLAGEDPVEREIHVSYTDTYLQGHGSVLHGTDGEKIGAVIVLNDITRLRHIENVRRDFVANVSHELKTPITSVLGFADTLRSGAAENKEDRDRFLEIIDKQASRLQSIVEDLLALSGIEDGVHRGAIDLSKGRIDGVIGSAVTSCGNAASEKGIELKTSCDQSLEASLNDELLEQAITNLLTNAIKYSDPGTRVDVVALSAGDEIGVHVKDQGPGIERRHLPRLFERFYRVDKSRSRKLGGTGLGLAIVKHVATAHGGRVAVESEIGQGSTFSIFLPAS